MGDYEDAIAEFQHRIDMGGWYEERFQAMLDQGRALVRLQRDPSERFKAAHTLCPWRAEPLYELSLWHDAQEKLCDGAEPWLSICRSSHRVPGYLLAKAAADLHLPAHDRLFIWHHVYDRHAALWTTVHAYYLADIAADAMDVGYSLANSLAARFPEDKPYPQNKALFDKLHAKFYGRVCDASGSAK